jgi:hypothetical protein
MFAKQAATICQYSHLWSELNDTDPYKPLSGRVCTVLCHAIHNLANLHSILRYADVYARPLLQRHVYRRRSKLYPSTLPAFNAS